MKSKIAVIGSGVSGVTSAILLQNFGFDVTIYSKSLFYRDNNDPNFASLFPSASIIPHSVYHSNLNKIFSNSNSLFSKLDRLSFPGLTVHEHFELYGYKTEIPDYAELIPEFESISDTSWTPKHPKIETKHGIQFNCFFADWKIYFPYLIKLFNRLGGKIIKQNIDLNSLHRLSEEIIINCSGVGSHKLKEEPSNPLVLKGHLVNILDTPLLTSPKGNTVSYNFTPGSDIYSDSSNNPLDVYCYPRTNDWILGGSRFKGSLDKNGKWASEDELSKDVPPEIEQLNSEIIEHTFGVDCSELKQRSYLYSYRYLRNKVDGLRLEKDQSYNQLIVHNYGHGGAGVTLSWGCAFEVLNLVTDAINKTTFTLDEVSEKLNL